MAYKSSDSYDEELEQHKVQAKYFSSDASIEAISWVNLHAKEICFFDPMSYEGNQVANLYSSDFATAALAFFDGTGAATWVEAVAPYEETMAKAVLTIYG